MGAHYFLGNRLLGTSPDLPRWEDYKVHHNNVAHFCPSCGEVWGRVMDSRLAGWFPQITPCAKHGNGSFISAWRNTFEELPPEVLHYELLLRLEKFDKGNENGTS